MCGIAGIIGNTGVRRNNIRCRIEGMSAQITHRGPDDSGIWIDERCGVAFGFRRLAINDLSPAGHQPMVSVDGRFVIVFNGEVYNFANLREELEKKGHSFRGHSDTEVMLAAISEWGVEAAVGKFVGMFAFGLWDSQTNAAYLVRDRLGIKPLYYCRVGRSVLFASELKCLRAHPDFVPEINREALALQLRFNYIAHPHTIYRNVYKLSPGCILRVKDGGEFAPKLYWTAAGITEQGLSNPYVGSDCEAIKELEHYLRESIKLRMVADVPLGAFLSGGIDSSIVVALMQTQSSRAIKTFTIGFSESAYNEAKHAKAVAQHLGTDHTELYLSPEEAMKVIPLLPRMFDEPFSDVSQIPTYLVSKLARESVTVSLSGDGGDELFGGYTRYFTGPSIWNKVAFYSPQVRRILSGMLRGLSPATWDRFLAPISPFLPVRLQTSLWGDKLHKLASVLEAKDEREFYRNLVSHWRQLPEVVKDIDESVPGGTIDWPEKWGLARGMMFADLVTYLPEDILTKVDRTSMAVSLEARVPFLDHRVVEFAARLPLSMKIRDGQGKWILRQVLSKYVPKSLVERPKMGFSVPIDSWLRGPLRVWAEDLLNDSRVAQEGYFHPGPIRKMWSEHLSGSRNWQYPLWNVLMFQSWQEEWAGSPTALLIASST